MQAPTAPPTPKVMVCSGPQSTDSYYPIGVVCPQCQTQVTTRVDITRGACWWIVLCLGTFLFFPLCYWLCCNSSKNATHYCPMCGSLLAIRKGGC